MAAGHPNAPAQPSKESPYVIPENAGPAAVIVLAAGAGTRMKSRTPKILHEIGGLSMVGHALRAARSIAPQRLAIVVRHERDLVEAHVAALDPQAVIVDQDDVPGTGRAVEAALEALHAEQDLTGTVVVTYGDVPLLSGDLLKELVATHEREGNAVTVLTAVLDDAAGYGRILRGEDGSVTGIREHKDASEAERAIREVNSGIYAFDAAVLRDALAHVTTENAQGEKYLTDVLSLARAAGGRVAAVVTEDRWQVEGANDRVQLSALGAEHNRRIVEAWMRAGVTVVDPATTWIDATVTLDEDVRLLPNTQLHGSTTVARDAVVGPFTYLRPGTVLGETGKIGAFYETKNVTIGRGSKLSHLGYAGDAEIGEDTNIGCGNITANYDGEKKHRTVIGSGVRTGSNTVFVAPVRVGDGAYSGAGAIIRQDVPAGALAVTLAKQRNSAGWVAANRPGSVSAALAESALAQSAPAGSAVSAGAAPT